MEAESRFRFQPPYIRLSINKESDKVAFHKIPQRFYCSMGLKYVVYQSVNMVDVPSASARTRKTSC